MNGDDALLEALAAKLDERFPRVLLKILALFGGEAIGPEEAGNALASAFCIVARLSNQPLSAVNRVLEAHWEESSIVAPALREVISRHATKGTK